MITEKGNNHFEVLPEGWIKVTHNSGLPLYLHKSQRVCTVSKPYFLGPGSVRKHEIPITAIPCLNYRRALDKEATQTLTTETADATEEASNRDDENSQSNDVSDVVTNGDSQSVHNDETDISSSPVNDENASDVNEPTDDAATLAPGSNKEPTAQPINTLPGILGTAKIETVTENTKAQSLTPQQINEYCKNLFIFRKLRVMRFT